MTLVKEIATALVLALVKAVARLVTPIVIVCMDAPIVVRGGVQEHAIALAVVRVADMTTTNSKY